MANTSNNNNNWEIMLVIVFNNFTLKKLYTFHNIYILGYLSNVIFESY